MADRPATITVTEAAELLGVSPWAAYQAIAADQFPVAVLRVGRRIVVPTAALERVLGLAEKG